MLNCNNFGELNSYATSIKLRFVCIQDFHLWLDPFTAIDIHNRQLGWVCECVYHKLVNVSILIKYSLYGWSWLTDLCWQKGHQFKNNVYQHIIANNLGVLEISTGLLWFSDGTASKTDKTWFCPSHGLRNTSKNHCLWTQFITASTNAS